MTEGFMNKELEELKAQKREIERRIKVLKGRGVMQYGNARIDVGHYPTKKPDRWYVAIKYQPPDSGSGQARWRSIYSNEDRYEVVTALSGIIADLEGLLELARNGGGEA